MLRRSTRRIASFGPALVVRTQANAAVANDVSVEERYLFDLNGFLLVKGVFTKDEVAVANAAIDHQAESFRERNGALRNTTTGTPAFLAGNGKSGRLDLGGCLEWGAESKIFKAVLAHPRLLPYYRLLMGDGYRMDHLPLVIAQDKGSEGFALHGGRIDHTGHYAPHLAYTYNYGVMHNPLLGVSVQLCDHGSGDGGFVALKGSHKANFPTPTSLAMGKSEFAEHLDQPVTSAGDVLLFSEGTVHGAAAWNADHQRRVVLYRFSPATCAYSRSYTPSWPENVLEGLSEGERAVLEPPYSQRLDRPVVTSDGSVEVLSRAQYKKDFDRHVFGSKYF